MLSKQTSCSSLHFRMLSKNSEDIYQVACFHALRNTLNLVGQITYNRYALHPGCGHRIHQILFRDILVIRQHLDGYLISTGKLQHTAKSRSELIRRLNDFEITRKSGLDFRQNRPYVKQGFPSMKIEIKRLPMPEFFDRYRGSARPVTQALQPRTSFGKHSKRFFNDFALLFHVPADLAIFLLLDNPRQKVNKQLI